MKMCDVARLLIREERSRGEAKESASQAVVRACERLRRPLASLVGVVGFRSLLSRALSLAKADVPWLAELQVGPDGSLELPAATEIPLSEPKAVEGGIALITQLLDLLVMFIGEGLTLRFVEDCWPKVSFKESKEDKP